MVARAHEIWSRLAEFEVDPTDASSQCLNRLASQNGWSRVYAARVFFEYKRFLLLAATAGHAVTPSHAVDQAWHLHLTYTRSYWRELCPHVLGRDVHHDPTRGGLAEAAHHRRQYARTLASYVEAFGEPPPKDIWPDPAAERREMRLTRVDAPMPVSRFASWCGGPRSFGLPAALSVTLALGLVGCTPNEAGTITLISVGMIFWVCVRTARQASGGRRRRDRNRYRGGDGGGCTAVTGGCAGFGGSDSGGSGGSDCGGGSGCGGGGCGGGE